MAEYGDRQRIRPTYAGRVRLLDAVEIVAPPHIVDTGTLGEYAELVAMGGQAEADVQMPDVAAHLGDGCAACTDDLQALLGALGETDEPYSPSPSSPRPDAPIGSWPAPTGSRPTPMPTTPGLAPDSPASADMSGDVPDSTSAPPAPPRGLIDSGIYAPDLPDPRAAEAAKAARRQRLRKLRDWLLIASAVAILLIGLSLVGLAYLASRQPTPRLGLTPVPADAGGGSVPGRAAPNGPNCPSTHPLKGNRASAIYHRPGQAFYDQTRPEDCFASPADAEAAGYRPSQR